MQKDKLSLSTAIYLVMGSMIGSGIFIVSADMSRILGSPLLLLMVWAITGLVTIAAALCYSELAGMYPQSGGQYQYLKEAYHPLLAFLYGWALFLVIQTGTIAAVAVAFAKFTAVLFPVFRLDNSIANVAGLNISAAQLLAIVSIIVLTFINTMGIKYGGGIQSMLTIIKAATLVFIIACGILIFRNVDVVTANFSNFFSIAKKSWVNNSIVTESWTTAALFSAIGVSLVGSLFSSDAWNNVTFIASEVVNPQKNVARSLIIGVLGVATLYLLANVSYLCLLPLVGHADGADVFQRGIQHASEDRVGTAAMTVMFGSAGTIVMAVLIMISTFGCNNGLILSGSRVYQAMANDGLFFNKMKELNSNGVPAFSLWVQCIWCSVLCLSGKYNDLLDYVMFAVVIFYILTVVGLIILRTKAAHVERLYKTPLYPVLPILYILVMSAFVFNLILQKPSNTIPGLVIVLLGIPVFYIWRAVNRTSNI